ncbi:hypothetical protein IIA79_00460 [bacterium]|nr:hypothetical protein [bacterium]
MSKLTNEVFSAGCPACDEAVELVNSLACPSCKVSTRGSDQSLEVTT